MTAWEISAQLKATSLVSPHKRQIYGIYCIVYMVQTTRTIGANVMENPLECATHKKGHNSGEGGKGSFVSLLPFTNNRLCCSLTLL